MAKKKLTTFKELCKGQVWRAVQFMIDGLLENDKRKDFAINMGSYALVDTRMCSGCAAICAVQKATGIEMNLGNIYSLVWPISPAAERLLNISIEDIKQFEMAIQNFRIGYMDLLFDYFNKRKERYVVDNMRLPPLLNGTWKKELHHYQEFANKLKHKGI